MEAHVKNLFYHLNFPRAFLVAALRITERYKEFLEKKVKEAEGRLKESLSTLLSDVVYWLELLKEELIPAMILLSKRIGVLVKSFEKGWIKDQTVIFKLLKLVRSVMEKAQKACLCALGKKQFERIEQFAKELLRNPEKLEEKEDEISELISELEELDKSLNAHFERLRRKTKRRELDLEEVAEG